MGEKNTCCFTGHRNIPSCELDKVRDRTKSAVEALIEKGVSTFICGGAIGFDMLCGEIVMEIKKQNSCIKLVVAVPCENQEKFFCAEDKMRYRKIIDGADRAILISRSYFNGCMQKRNRFMVDQSAYVICYCTKTSGGSFYTKNYAGSKECEIIEISDEM